MKPCDLALWCHKCACCLAYDIQLNPLHQQSTQMVDARGISRASNGGYANRGCLHQSHHFERMLAPSCPRFHPPTSSSSPLSRPLRNRSFARSSSMEQCTSKAASRLSSILLTRLGQNQHGPQNRPACGTQTDPMRAVASGPPSARAARPGSERGTC